MTREEKDKFIDKASKWIEENMDKDMIIYHNNTWRKVKEFIDNFRKAMEE